MASDSPFGDLSETIRSLLVEELDLTDKAGWSYIKALPIKRSLRKTLLRSRWCVHIFSREFHGKEDEFKVLEKDGIVYLGVDVLRSKGFNLRGSSAIYRASLWAAARGQLEGIFGAPPRHEGPGELAIKQMFLWAVADQASKEFQARRPFFLMEVSLKSSLWGSPLWNGFSEEYDVPVLEMTEDAHEEKYHLVTNLDLYGNGTPTLITTMVPDASVPPSTWPRWLKEAINGGVHSWRKRPDEVYLARLLSRMDAPLDSMTDRGLRKWAQHVRDGHVPYNCCCRTCVETAATGRAHQRVLAPSCYVLSLDVLGPLRIKGETADDKKFRYVLAGPYTMPKLEVYKDVEIPPDCDGESSPEDQAERPAGEPPDVFDEDAGGEVRAPLSQEEEEQDARDNEKFARVFREVGDSMEYQVLHFATPMVTRRTAEVHRAVQQLYLQLRAEGLPVVRVHSDRARELRTPQLRE